MYKLKKELPKEFKIKVNPQQSEALQKHLFSIGKKWNRESRLSFTDKPYLYCSHHTYLGYGATPRIFHQYELERIKFKDYFEKVEIYTNKEFPNFSNLLNSNEFPEKWCILVTEDNYQELNTWMHRNWKNYKHYNENWDVSSNHLTGYYRFHSHSNHAWSYPIGTETYTLITTEQFRAKYGDLQPKYEGYTTVSDKTIKEEYEERKQLRLGNELLKRDNDKLLHKVLMLTEKLETIKKVIE